MPIRNPTILLVACALGCAPVQVDEVPTTTAGRPNIVLIVVDTLRADHADADRMPHVERLASDGVRFDEAFAHAPLTLPSHASLFASQPPDRTGVAANGEPLGNETRLPEWLASYGYDTAAAVSLATLWPRAKAQGLDRGFEQYEQAAELVAPSAETSQRLDEIVAGLDPRRPFFLFAHFADPHEPYDAHGLAERAADVYLDGQPIAQPSTSSSSEIRASAHLDRGVHRLEVHSAEPFRARKLDIVADCGPLAPTWSLGAPNEFTTLLALEFQLEHASEVAVDLWLHDLPADLALRYEREVRAVDRAVGEFLDELRGRGLYDDALIVFTSDHGEALGERAFVGHGEHLFDELLRVPLVIKAPASHPLADDLSEVRARMVRSIDLAPTILEFAGLPALPNQAGTSILTPSTEPLFAATRPTVAPGVERLPLVALRDQRFKLVHDVRTGRYQLFDLRQDPAETNALATDPEALRPGWAGELERRAAALTEPTSLQEGVLAELAALGY